MKYSIACLAFLAMTFWEIATQAHEGMGSSVPNGASFGCALCHLGAGGTPMNCFGNQVKNSLTSGSVDWSSLYDLDADEDQFTNGEELGDPNGTWRNGDADPDYPASKPYDGASTPCGNGLLEESEICDQDDFGGLSCMTEGFVGGRLLCVEQCSRIDTSNCNMCGNDRIDDGEECDGPDLGGASCESQGYDAGDLECSDTCIFDNSSCSNNSPECGNGLKEEGEQCDGSDLDGASCQSLGYQDGELACSPSTCRFDTGSCSNAGQAVCGNGKKEIGEQCDGADLGGESCQSLGYVNGALACLAGSCRLDATDCNNDVTHTCGNGIREAGEECDGDDLGDWSCLNQGFGGGTLSCVDCKVDVSGCDSPGSERIVGGCSNTDNSSYPYINWLLWITVFAVWIQIRRWS